MIFHQKKYIYSIEQQQPNFDGEKETSEEREKNDRAFILLL